MSGGLATTWQVLTKTRNSAVTDVLAPLLESYDGQLVKGCIKTLARRRDSAGHRVLLSTLDLIDETALEGLADLPGRMTSALREALNDSDAQLCENALKAIRQVHEYELVPALVTLAEGKGSLADAAAAAVVYLSQHLFEELSGKRRATDHRDPQRLRGQVFSAIESSMQRFGKHRRREIIEAFVLLAPPNNRALRQILDDPSHDCHASLLDTLCSTSHACLAGQLVSLVLKPGAPRGIIQVVGERVDLAFIRRLLNALDASLMDNLYYNLKQLGQIRWIDPVLGIVDQLSGLEQEKAVELAVRSGIRRVEVFELLSYVIAKGKPEGRLAACEALAKFQGDVADRLVLDALNDPYPLVQAEAAKQLRSRSIPDAIARLAKLLDSPHATVCDAARTSLSEFTFDRYRASFDHLSEAAQLAAGKLVKKVDPSLTEELRIELASPARSRRLRAIEMALASSLVESIQDSLIQCLHDEDHFIRASAAWALGHSNSPATRKALTKALADRSVAVQQAARTSLSELSLAQHPAADDVASGGGRQGI